MYCQSLELRNFQGHARLDLSFSRRITTLVGATDAGKSSVLRALRWVLTNNLLGDGFIRNGADRVAIRMRVHAAGERWEVIRRKGKNRINTYSLNGRTFRSFTTNVPEELAQLFRVDDINFQGQYDGPFWFDESAAEVSRRLNSVIDLSVIDTALAGVAATVRHAQERVNVSEERLEAAKEENEKLRGQKKRVREFADLQAIAKEGTEAAEDAHLLETFLRDFDHHKRAVGATYVRSQDANSVFAVAKSAMRSSRDCEILGNLIKKAQAAGVASIGAPDFGPVRRLFTGYEKLRRDAAILSGLLADCEEAGAILVSASSAAIAAEEEYHKQVKGEKCPLCGNRIR